MFSLIFVLLLGFNANADVGIGLSYSKHIITKDLNDFHPYSYYEVGDYGTLTYINSYSKVGVALYKKYEMTDGKYAVNIRVGLTTGYKRIMRYNGKTRRLKGLFIPKTDLVVLLVPELIYNIDKDYYVNGMLIGEAMSLGFGVSF